VCVQEGALLAELAALKPTQVGNRCPYDSYTGACDSYMDAYGSYRHSLPVCIHIVAYIWRVSQGGVWT
jgi:hypothetical protein